MRSPVNITVFRWAGAWGPFKVSIPCGECALTGDIIRNCMQTDLAGIDIELDLRDWLSEWWRPLVKGGWHAPIVMVNGQVISQGIALNRGVLVQTVIEAATADTPLEGNHIYGKPGCPHCVRAKGLPGGGRRPEPIPRRDRGHAGALRDAGPREADHRSQDTRHRPADLDRWPVRRRRRRPARKRSAWTRWNRIRTAASVRCRRCAGPTPDIP